MFFPYYSLFSLRYDYKVQVQNFWQMQIEVSCNVKVVQFGVELKEAVQGGDISVVLYVPQEEPEFAGGVFPPLAS